MSDIAPYAGLSRDRLTALVNLANKSTFQEGTDFTYGAPVAAGDTSKGNTDITLYPLHPKQDPIAVSYDRLGIDILSKLPAGILSPVVLPNTPQFSAWQILGRINQALGLNLTPEEVENTLYSIEQEAFVLSIQDGSLAWIVSQFAFPYVLSDEPLPLSEVITQTVSSGLIYLS